MSSTPELISAILSAIAVGIGLVTLVTVFVAAKQLLTEHQAYQLGLSPEALGPWHEKVKTKQLLGLQQQISTPTITLRALVKNQWMPEITFPLGFDSMSVAQQHHRDPEKALAKASWVNFVQALGLSPQERRLYRMNVQSTLVNGIIPMRWAGKDLVGICTMLGFQSSEDKPSFKTPMPLPIQWSGPLGWLQFRRSPDGCVVEFRRRMVIGNQLSSDIHNFYHGMPRTHEPHSLSSRLWQSINGMSLANGRVLYLGGADRQDGHTAKKELEKAVGELEGLLAKLKGATESSGKPDGDEVQDDGLFDELMQSTMSYDEIVRRLRDTKPENVEQAATKDNSEAGQVPDFLREALGKKVGKKEVFTPCQGLLSTVVEGELADSRGLNIADCVEYHRKYVDYADIDKAKFKYHLGNLNMDDTLLPLLKEAMGILKPDGYFFTPTPKLNMDIFDIYQHVADTTNKDKARIFPTFELAAWPRSYQHRNELHHAMLLCNEFQYIRKHHRATFTVADMVVIAKASCSLRKKLSTPPDLSWAMLVCPQLFSDLAQAFEDLPHLDGLDTIKANCQGGILDCTELMRDSGSSANAKTAPGKTTYNIPLCSDGDFTGNQVLAAFMDVLITYFWIEKKWISDVGLYDAVIPATITMC